ncbi:MAG: hypothetical protein JXB48_15195 [Candidatus Latescibacteria bacterium]|nr:hypothetical protein [Candidatus Latescibacterota bacterium]
MRTRSKASVVCILLFSIMIFTAAISTQAADGGFGPMLGSCCLGPRIGLEMNEGQEIEIMEVLPILPYVGGIFRLWLSYDYGYKAAGGKGFLASCCIGPRVGKEFGERKLRSIEKLYPIPIINLYPWIAIGIEAYQGKTMVEIEKAENLKR